MQFLYNFFVKSNYPKTAIQKRLWSFIYEFRDTLVEKYAAKVAFIIIYGSAVRGEFVAKKSDVDILIQVLRPQDKVILEKNAGKIFWQIARDYPELGFKESLSVSKKKQQTLFSSFLTKAEKASFLFVPVFIFSLGEIDWKNGVLHSKNPLVLLGSQLLVPQRSVFLKFKHEGRILFGRDIRKEIKIRLTLLDRLRLGTAPQLLSWIGFLSAPFAVKKARSYAAKALLYQIDGLLTALSNYRKLTREQKITRTKKILIEDFARELQTILRLNLNFRKTLLQQKDFSLFEKAAAVKAETIKLNRYQTLQFCFQAWWFIVRSNLQTISYLILKLFRHKHK
jgi:hypothetical protein